MYNKGIFIHETNFTKNEANVYSPIFNYSMKKLTFILLQEGNALYFSDGNSDIKLTNCRFIQNSAFNPINALLYRYIGGGVIHFDQLCEGILIKTCLFSKNTQTDVLFLRKKNYLSFLNFFFWSV